MNIDVYTFAHNEQAILPFFLRHYSPIARKIVIYDDCSNDRTVEIAQRDPKVEVRQANLGDHYDEERFRQLKNSCWKGSDADWVIVVDIDEFLYHPNLWGQLLSYREMTISLPKVRGFDMVAEAGLPSYDVRLTDVIKTGVQNNFYSKQVIFNPQKIEEINFDHGAHTCQPRGEVVVGGDLKLLHFNWLGFDYINERWAQRRARVSPIAAERAWKTFDWPEEEIRFHHRSLLDRARVVIE